MQSTPGRYRSTDAPLSSKRPWLSRPAPICRALRLHSSGVLVAMASSTLLWALLYSLNEKTDLWLKSGFPVRRASIYFKLIASLGVCLLAGLFAPLLGTMLAIMVVGQAAYCLPPCGGLSGGSSGGFVLSGIINVILHSSAEPCGGVNSFRSSESQPSSVFIWEQRWRCASG